MEGGERRQVEEYEEMCTEDALVQTCHHSNSFLSTDQSNELCKILHGRQQSHSMNISCHIFITTNTYTHLYTVHVCIEREVKGDKVRGTACRQTYVHAADMPQCGRISRGM